MSDSDGSGLGFLNGRSKTAMTSDSDGSLAPDYRVMQTVITGQTERIRRRADSKSDGAGSISGLVDSMFDPTNGYMATTGEHLNFIMKMSMSEANTEKHVQRWVIE